MWAAALADGDMAAALEGAAGPVAAWLRHVDVVARALGDVPFERVNTAQATEDPRVESDAVVFGGPLVYGPENPPPPPRVLTDLELVSQDGGWRVSSLHRDGIPIERYVSGGTEAGAVSSDGVTGRVLAVFHDASCSADPDCPREGAELVSVAIAVDNAAAAPLAPSEFWLETSQGRVDPVDAGATDFPPGGSGVGFAVFPAAGQLSEGGTLQLRLDAGGTPVELALPVPAFSPS